VVAPPLATPVEDAGDRPVLDVDVAVDEVSVDEGERHVADVGRSETGETLIEGVLASLRLGELGWPSGSSGVEVVSFDQEQLVVPRHDVAFGRAVGCESRVQTRIASSESATCSAIVGHSSVLHDSSGVPKALAETQ